MAAIEKVKTRLIIMHTLKCKLLLLCCFEMIDDEGFLAVRQPFSLNPEFSEIC